MRAAQIRMPAVTALTVLVFLFLWFLPDFFLGSNWQKEVTHPLAHLKEREILERCIERPVRRKILFQELSRRGANHHRYLLVIASQEENRSRLRHEALIALSKLQSPLVFAAALAVLDSVDDSLLTTAVYLLGQKGGKKAVPPLMNLLEKSGLPMSLRAQALRSLYRIRGRFLTKLPQDESELQGQTLLFQTWWRENRHLSQVEWYLQLFDSEDRRDWLQGVELIGQWGKEGHRAQAFDLLADQYRREYPRLKIKILQWMNQLQPDRALEYLDKGLADENPKVQTWAILYTRGYPQETSAGRNKLVLRREEVVIEKLAPLTNSADWTVRRQVYRILGTKSYRRGMKLLRKGLRDSHREVRYQAAWSFQQRGFSDGVVVAAADLKVPKHRRKAIVLLRGIFRQSFGLHSRAGKEEVEVIARRWLRFLRNNGWLKK